MRLGAFFAAIGPMLVGQEPLGEARARLYGEAPSGAAARDAERLAIYERFCRGHRLAALGGVYPYCRGAVERAGGEAAWAALVEAFFRAHPMRSFELNENGAALPGFLGEWAGAAALPPFLPELADFEWWEWQTQVAEDAAEDLAPERGPLRMGATVELRPYRYDFLSWLEAEEAERAAAPEAEETLVLFWRDRDLVARRDRALPLELLVLRTVYEGGSVEALLQQGSALPRERLEETISDLRQAGILLGGP